VRAAFSARRAHDGVSQHGPRDRAPRRGRRACRRQRRDGRGSGARAEAILPSSIGSIALVARKTSGRLGA